MGGYFGHLLSHVTHTNKNFLFCIFTSYGWPTGPATSPPPGAPIMLCHFSHVLGRAKQIQKSQTTKKRIDSCCIFAFAKK